MNGNHRQPHDASETDPSARVDLALSSVESALRQYLLADSAPSPEDVEQATRQVRAVTEALADLAPASRGAFLDRARRIARLHDRLTLAARQERAEAAARLGQVRKGKATLKAYRRAR